MTGALSGAYGNLDWSPMRYVNHAFSQSVLTGVYSMAQVGLVTPLRDGMNLVAKEYVAAQDPDDPGFSYCRASPARRQSLARARC